MKRAIIVLTVLSIVRFLYAIPSSEFIIGAYSNFQMSNVGFDYSTKFYNLGQKMHLTGFNTAIYDINEPGHYTQSILGSALNALEDNEIKTILQDGNWTPDKAGTIPLSYGIYLKLEAEYSLDDTTPAYTPDVLVDEIIDDKNNYVFKRATGSYKKIQAHYSNDFTWRCSESQNNAGVVLSYPRRRWKNSNPGWTSQAYPSLLSEEIKHLYSFYYGINNPINSSRIYITFAINSDSLISGEQIASFKLKVLNGSRIPSYNRFGALPDPSCYDEITLTPCAVNGQTIYGPTIIEEDTSEVPRDRFGNRLYEFFIDPPSLYDPLYGEYFNDRYYYHFSPEVYWYGNGVFSIDYITIEDNIHRSMRLEQESSIYYQKLDTQLNSINDPRGNIIMHYGRDEHSVSNFDTYKLVESYLESMTPPRDFITATNTSNDWTALKNNGEPYLHQRLFLKQYKPNNMMIDCYALSSISEWKEDYTNQYSIQRRIDDILHYFYFTIAKTRQTESPQTKLFFTPQNHGIWGDSGTWKLQAPPKSMIKCLQLLPLCYDADGIVSFAFSGNEFVSTEGGIWVTPYCRDSTCGNLVRSHYTNSAVPLSEANRKISIYGPIIRSLNWITSNRIMTSGIATYSNPTMGYSLNDGINLSSVQLDCVSIQTQPGDMSSYHGYVQAGFYHDNTGLPCYMFVNRRAVLKENETNPAPNTQYADDTYVDAPPQTIRLTTSSSAPSLFGTQDVAFIDPYDYQIYKREGTTFIDVEIAPGDGKLLQMAGTPALVENQNVTARTLLAIKGGLCVNSESTFTIAPGSKTFIDENTVIRVMNKATLIIEGDVRIGRNAQLKVDNGGKLIFNNANVTYLPGAKIISNHATVTIGNSIFTPAYPDSVWEGISTTNMSTLNIVDSKIVNALSIVLHNTNLYMEGAKIQIPVNGFGLNISDRVGGLTTVITSSDSTATFSGPGMEIAGMRGITIWATQSPIVITNQKFDYLESGIYCPMELLNSITVGGCTFASCHFGIRLMSKDISIQVSNSVFEQNVEGVSATMGAVPLVTRCTFNNCKTGIFSEYSLYTGSDPRQASNCLFFECENGVVSRSSNARLIDNQFVRNEVGILSHVDSNLNLSVNANNRFNNTLSNLAFRDNDVYKAYIQLVFGHNDFYHTLENSQTANDFEFDDNYFELQGSSTISADYNWFQDQTVKVNGNDYSDYVIANNFDQSPNSAPPLEPSCRFYQALDYESQGLYSQARALYQLIIEEKLEGEDIYINSAIDGLFRLAHTPDHMYEMIDLYTAEALETAVSNPRLSALLTDYLIKGYVNNKDYQTAIDLIQPRITNAISEVDSLCAVLDLEIVLYLASIDEAKKPLTTLYRSLIYPSPQIFDTKHGEHLAQLYQMTGATEQYTPPIVERATITANYPNPFNPSTTIEFSSSTKGAILLQLFNLRGQLVTTLVNETMDKGTHKVIWNGCDSTGRRVSSGIYFIRLSSGASVDTRKILMIK